MNWDDYKEKISEKNGQPIGMEKMQKDQKTPRMSEGAKRSIEKIVL